jgi:hypothetical protein
VTGQDDEGPVVAVLPVESLDVAYTQLMALGAECEVLEPPSLRARFRETGRRMAALHDDAGAGPPGKDQR